MFAVIQVIKRLAITGTAAIVDGVDGIAVVDQILNQRPIADLVLASRPVMNPTRAGTRSFSLTRRSRQCCVSLELGIYFFQ